MRQALEMALEALEERASLMKWQKARDAVKEALAQPEQCDCPKEGFCGFGSRCQDAQPEREPDGYVQTVIDALYENSDPVSVEAAELLERMTQPEQEPVAWVNWCAATGKRSVSFECESELASQPLYTKEQS